MKNKIRIAVSPFTKNICAGRVNDKGTWLGRENVTAEALAAVCEYVLSTHDGTCIANYKGTNFQITAVILGEAVPHQGANVPTDSFEVKEHTEYAERATGKIYTVCYKVMTTDGEYVKFRRGYYNIVTCSDSYEHLRPDEFVKRFRPVIPNIPSPKEFQP